MQVIIGSGSQKKEGFVSVDISDKCGADIVADVREPWTWAKPITRLEADNLLEHLNSEELIKVMNEAYDRMTDGGIFWIRVPLLSFTEAGVMAAFTDPTHKSYFTMQTFDYWDRDHARQEYGRDYGIKPWKRLTNKQWGERFLIVELQK